MYKIIYHHFVLEKDFKNLSEYEKDGIARAIHNKLTVEPHNFGKPLTGLLKGFYRLRVNKFRVVYQIKDHEVAVFIFQIGKRKDSIVYEEAIKRLRCIDFN